ncbi:hypothetical protein FA10DRAFT_159514 [Acaromyces ingoldii]|uniref:Uncharacterized protein n=1 Tax=Acaromyces ingoldii TaxID=215250 RepID=A0A316YFU5_9BASI|nr:hypothetical protein FA10DRAFT_159514 [Acaromyces ingoldii]PWN88287.1 hypothetical protein FA10DRAFT_159514 [Acaromyces ingoldii]
MWASRTSDLAGLLWSSEKRMIAFSMASSPKFHLHAPFPATVSMLRSANTRRHSVFLRRRLRFLRCDVIFSWVAGSSSSVFLQINVAQQSRMR